MLLAEQPLIIASRKIIMHYFAVPRKDQLVVMYLPKPIFISQLWLLLNVNFKPWL